MRLRRILDQTQIIILCFGVSTTFASAMALSGPITANSVIATGDVTVSSITISTLTVTASLNVLGTAKIPGHILQMAYSSTTVQSVAAGTTNFMSTNLSQSLSLKNATNYIRISLSGELSTPNSNITPYLTIYRDSTNLGDPITGLSTALVGGGLPAGALNNPVGITLIDSPEDTISHTYTVFIRTTSASSGAAYFPYNGFGIGYGSIGYLTLEEIGIR